MNNISKETFERLLSNEAHKSLCVINVGTGRNPDYIVAGIGHLIKDMSKMLYPENSDTLCGEKWLNGDYNK